MTISTEDPVLIKRAKITRQVSFGLKFGYGLYLLATTILIYRTFTDPSRFIDTSIALCLILGSLLLAPAIVFKYAIKAANRADRENSW